MPSDDLVGAVFITHDSSQMIVVEDVAAGDTPPTDVVFYRIVISDSRLHLGKQDWGFRAHITNPNGPYSRIA